MARKDRRYPVATLGRIPQEYPPMRVFSSMPMAQRRLACLQLVAAGPAFAAMIFGTWVLGLVPGLKKSWWDMVVLIVCAAVGLIASVAVMRRFSLRYMASLEQSDSESLGAPPPEERYVGIAYCDQVWVFRRETTWDRGYITVVEGCLAYRGFGPSFRLPLKHIREVRLAATESPFNNNIPRVFVDWMAPGGLLNTFSLEVRVVGTKEEGCLATEELAQWIDRERSLAPSVEPSGTVWPFESTSLEFNSNPGEQKVEVSDRLIAVSAALVLFLSLVLAAGPLRRLVGEVSGIVFGISGPMVLGIYRSVVYARVKSRGAKPERL